MAKKPVIPDNEENPKSRTFKQDSTRFVSIKVGEDVKGVFIGVQTVSITDTRTRLPKELFIFKLRDEESGAIKKVPCTAMMLNIWHDMVDELANGDEAIAVNLLRNQIMTIHRGEDMRTNQGNPMGTYEIDIEQL